MIKFENTQVFGFEPAIRGMRNPKNSWDKSDSKYNTFNTNPNYSEQPKVYTCYDMEHVTIGENDKKLMQNLVSAGTDHSKFMRMIVVWVDITAPQFWWHEFDTYKIATVRNSCSKMHTIHVKPFEYDDFTHEGIDKLTNLPLMQTVFKNYIEDLEMLRQLFDSTQDKRYWRALIEMLPEGYNMRATVMLNYQVLRNMYQARKAHKLTEWHSFCEWVETLPYSELITGGKQCG